MDQRHAYRAAYLGGPYFAATAINNNGHVVGFGQTSTFAQHGFLYKTAR